jgi:branched-chain amino acid transport system substrate-binding protein
MKSLFRVAVALSMITGMVTSARAAEPFRLGVVIPKTGTFGQYGDFIEQGLTVGAKQVNAAGGINGRNVELVIRDDASNPGRSLLAAKELISSQKIDALYPEVISGLVLAVLPYTSEQKVITFSNGAAPQIGDAAKFPYSFQYADLSVKRGPALAAAIRKLGGKRVGILTSTNPPQVALGEFMSAEFPKKYGLEVVGYQKFASDAKDLSSQLQSLRDAGADIIAFSATARDNVRVAMSSIQTLGWNVKLVAEPAALYGDLREQVPEPLWPQFFAVNYRVGVRTGATSTERDDLISQLKAFGPISNLGIAAAARDVVWLAKWAFETTQKQKGSTTPDDVRATLETLGKSDYPPTYSLTLGNPRYEAGDHTTGHADYSKFWALVHVSPLVDGAYEGEALDLID